MEIHFKTDRFKLTGPVRDDANAGNRLYGEDLALWLAKTLARWNLTVIDEDWGWLAASARDENCRTLFEIGVYAYPDDGQSSDYGEWMLTVNQKHKVKWLGIFSQWKDVTLSAEFEQAVRSALADLAIDPV